MVRQLGQVSYNTFVKGLITEAGPLTFPDNATIEDMNCVLTLKGSHRRRYGISEESDGRLPLLQGVVNEKKDNVFTYLWQDAANSFEDFLLVFLNNYIHIYSIEKGEAVAKQPTAVLALENVFIKESFNKHISCDVNKGALFCTITGYEPFYIEYDPENKKFILKALYLKIRDLKGIDDGLPIQHNPLDLTAEHTYNLLNQGWYYTNDIQVNPTQTAENIIAGLVDTEYVKSLVKQMDVYVNGRKTFSQKIDNPAQVYWVDLFNAVPGDKRAYYKIDRIELDSLYQISGSIFFVREQETDPASLTISLLYDFPAWDLYDVTTTVGLNTDSVKITINSLSLINEYYQRFNKYPSNAQQWFVAKNAQGSADFDVLEEFSFGNTPAAKGHFIIDAFTEDRSLVSGLNLPASKKDTYRCSSCASTNGHIFYSLKDRVLFSQIVEDLTKANKCYQEGDPASEASFDLVDTDGGVIEIPGITEIVKLKEVLNGIVVFTDSGIWSIGGVSSDEAFKATSFAIRKISSIDCISSKSCVTYQDAVFFWSSSGIYVIAPNQYGVFEAQSLSENTIQKIYFEIPKHNRQHALGVFDKGCQKIYWLYDITSKEDVVPNRYTRGIVYDIRLQAFYEMSFGVDDTYPYICGAFNTPWFETINFNKEVFDNENELVYDNEGEIVYTKVITPNSSLTNVKFLACTPPTGDEKEYKYTVCSFDSLSFTDWATSTREGIPYESYFTTGYNIAGESDSKKDIVYLTTQLSRTEDAYEETSLANRSSCQMQIRWDYENTSYSGKWTQPVQIYRANRLFVPTLEDPNYDHRGLPVVTTKHKVRGNGRAIQIKFTSEPGKNFEVLGWSMILGNRK